MIRRSGSVCVVSLRLLVVENIVCIILFRNGGWLFFIEIYMEIFKKVIYGKVVYENRDVILSKKNLNWVKVWDIINLWFL